MSLDDLFQHHSDALDPDNLRLLGLIVETGIEPGLLVALVDFVGIKLAEDDRRFLLGPFVLHSARSWRPEAPDWLLHLGRVERFEIVVEKKPGIVGPAELTAVMYEATMQSPLRRELTELYLWASVNACVRHYRRDRGEMWKLLDMKPIEDSDVIEPGGRLWHDYEHLAQAIRRKVVRAQQQRERDEAATEKRIAQDRAAREAGRAAHRERMGYAPKPEKLKPQGYLPRLI